MSSIGWTDTIGSGSLSNLKPAPGNRFGAWTPRRRPIGPAVTGLGTGQLHRFEFRRDDTISFEIAAIPGSELELALRLEYHLLNGGEVALDTDRPLAADFETCILAPDTEPSIDFTDRENLEYTFSVTLKAGTSEVGAGGMGYAARSSQVTLAFDAGEELAIGLIASPMYMVFGGTITLAALEVLPSGSLVLDVLKNGVSICAVALPTVSAGVESVDTTLTGWTIGFAAGDTLQAEVISVTDVEAFTLSLKTTRL